MLKIKNTDKLISIPTPFYYYDVNLLKATLALAKKETEGAVLHYALKANSNPKILRFIAETGFGVDCVSGNEILRAIECGFKPEHVTFAGVGKTDKEINIGLDLDIFCFNCESIQELEVIQELAKKKNKTVNIALRINPNVNANSHHYITTGLEENKFGISSWEFEDVLDRLKSLPNLNLFSIHFHIGSQITDMSVFRKLAKKVNEFNSWFTERGVNLEHINVGGGLGVDYHFPDKNPIPDFASYVNEFKKHLVLRDGQQLHYELGRALVAQSGSLITKVLYVKNGKNTNFAIVDAGMTDLIRPALYQAYHKIENLSSTESEEKYDVVGPICESSDTFAKGIMLPKTYRGNLLALRSAGAYGEIMASGYNLRDLPSAVYSDEIG